MGSLRSSYEVSPDWRLNPSGLTKEQTTETMDPSPKTKGLRPYPRQWNLELVGAARLPGWGGQLCNSICSRGRGYSQKNWLGVCSLSKALTLFMTRICNFPYSLFTMTWKLKVASSKNHTKFKAKVQTPHTLFMAKTAENSTLWSRVYCTFIISLN